MLRASSQNPLHPIPPSRKPFTALASKLQQADLGSIRSEHYEGGHWLGTFAVYLVSGRNDVVMKKCYRTATREESCLRRLFHGP